MRRMVMWLARERSEMSTRLVEKPEEEIPLPRSRSRWKNYLNNVKDIPEDMWIELIRIRIRSSGRFF
jgi:hypothetical protein